MWPIIRRPAPAETWRRRGQSVPLDLRRKSAFDAPTPRGLPRSELSQKFSPAPIVATAGANEPAARVPQNLPAEIAFLVHYGIASGVLMAAAAAARTQGVTADAVLLAEGKISEDHFYRSLARHLRLPFVDADVRLAAAVDYPQCVRAGIVPLGGLNWPVFLIAPRGRAVAELITALRHSASEALAIATPTHLFELMRAAARREIAWQASLGLWSSDPKLSAKDGASRNQSIAALTGVGTAAVFSTLAPGPTAGVCGLILSLAFLAVIWLRLAACAASRAGPAPSLRSFKDVELPIYSIVVALYREARIVPQLLAALDTIDYPRAKLDVKFVLEEDDAETLRALTRTGHVAGREIIVAPARAPRTKPRALNVALPLLRGQFVVVFDAEDVPDPGQIKMAVQRFAAAPQRLCCLQARLAIDNAGDSWLTRLFTIEYAALFHVINVGFGALRLPFPLGGSSNHFRVEALRKIGGWDAWNVTEDADIGLRLARLGYYAETFASVTYEEAPAKLKDFLGQRRRWCKGWYQTLIVLCRDPRRLFHELGPVRCGAALIALLSYALAPLAGPPCALWLAADVALDRLSWPSGFAEIGLTTLWVAVFVTGVPAILWPAFVGLKRRRLLSLWPWLVLFPFYSLLICYAAWISIYDLVRRPQHWYKTEHGLARTSRRQPLSIPRERTRTLGA
ncbi:MAG: glycosyltransferase family 2 protein [Methylovirgula sp.]